MSRVSTSRFELFDRWRAMAFLVAGGALLINFILLVFERYLGVSTPGVLGNVLILSALLAAAIGLLGLYPRLADHSPRLALASLVPTAVAGLGFGVLLVWVVPARLLDQPLPPGILLIATVAMMLVGFLLFGITSLRTNVPSRTVGLLLAAVVGILLIYLGAQAVYGSDPPTWVSPAVTGLLAVVTLSIGYVQRTDAIPADHTTPTA